MKEKADRPRVVSKYAVVNNKKMGNPIIKLHGSRKTRRKKKGMEVIEKKEKAASSTSHCTSGKKATSRIFRLVVSINQ